MKKVISIISVLLVSLTAFAESDVPRTSRKEYYEDLAGPSMVVFSVRKTGLRLGDLAGLCEAFVIIFNH